MQLPSTWNLPESIRDRFGEKSLGKQRAMVADDHLLLVLHKAPEKGDRDREAVLFWRKPDGYWECSKGGVAYQQLVNHLKEYNLAEEELSQSYENAQTAEDYFEILEAITPLQIATKNLHATLQTAREEVPEERKIIDFRDWAYEIERGLDILYNNTKNALDFKIAKQAEEQSKFALESLKSEKRLNTLVSIFFPLTAISCVFGMNLTSGLENQNSLLFWIVFLSGILLGLIVRHWVFTGTLSNITFHQLAKDIKRNL